MAKGHIAVKTYKEALHLQDIAAQHSSMPYRAPELVNVAADIVVTHKSDIWSLGCLLYAMAFYKTPFEAISENGGSLLLAIAQGKVVFPMQSTCSENCRQLMLDMLVEPATRLNIDQVLDRIEQVLGSSGY